MPIVVASKLSENFFDNQGLVDWKTAAAKATRDSMHAMWHAYLLVGYMKLPQSMQADEGRVCFIASNSWGEGWGKGGYACVTERWFKEMRFPMPFLAVTDVEVP